MSKRILIIKMGASGDVVRTSVLLHLFKNQEVTWVTEPTNKYLLPQQRKGLDILSPGDAAYETIPQEPFDLAVCLDDKSDCAKLASKVQANTHVGAFWHNNKVVYTDSSCGWFDMGLVSRYTRAHADDLKMKNRNTYQAILYQMFGKTFRGEEYLLNESVTPQPITKRVGLEVRAGKRWPTKVWHRYFDLANKLRAKGYEIFFFKQRDNIVDHLRDVATCNMIVTSDSLAMHLALGLKIPTVAIFTVTSSHEIYGYNRMEKVVSPKLKQAFYSTEYRLDVLEAITLNSVEKAIENLLKNSRPPKL